MKELFLLLRRELMNIDGINWVDLNKGQLNDYDNRPEIDFPAVLLNISYPRVVNLTRKQQQCDVLIEATVVFDFMDDTSSITPLEILEASLSVYGIIDSIHAKLQGLMDIEVIRSPIDRLQLKDIQRRDRLKTFVAIYSTKIIE